MRESALFALALAFPCLFILGGLLVALRRQVPPVPFKDFWLFMGLGIVAIILHITWCLSVDAFLYGRVSYWLYIAFLTAAIPEEGFRYLVIRYGLARRCRDGLVTAMLLGSLVGLTFGTVEHVVFVMNDGWLSLLARSFTAVPFHTLSGAVLGYCGAVAIRTRLPWGLAALSFLVLAHASVDWPLIDEGGEEPFAGYELLRSEWTRGVVMVLVVTVLAAVLARIARKSDAAAAEHSAASDPAMG